jgi:ubiquinone/menaquinone biosynthesis C-methylase UbiE
MTNAKHQWYERRQIYADKTRFYYRLGRVLRSPQRLGMYLRRYLNSKRFSLRAKDQEDHFRMYVDNLASRSAYGAVGPTSSRRDWEKIGRLQFEYLVKSGLRPEHKLLDIGCGNLRGGHLIIRHLMPHNYVGLDISREILLSALSVIEEFSLQNKVPYLFTVRDMDFSFLPENHFDWVHAHSVFSHCEQTNIEKCLRAVKRVLKRDGIFDFTFLESSAKDYNLLKEDYYFSRNTMINISISLGFTAEVMDDWEYAQTKVRLRHA